MAKGSEVKVVLTDLTAYSDRHQLCVRGLRLRASEDAGVFRIDLRPQLPNACASKDRSRQPYIVEDTSGCGSLICQHGRRSSNCCNRIRSDAKRRSKRQHGLRMVKGASAKHQAFVRNRKHSKMA